ncbi:hypothetical protein [Peribacillus butanolivorans]|uniref:hypothetical protein n=1 Tax=Peribacillus butanolivorans TaxID=421767 RepID=UPI0026C14509
MTGGLKVDGNISLALKLQEIVKCYNLKKPNSSSSRRVRYFYDQNLFLTVPRK